MMAITRGACKFLPNLLAYFIGSNQRRFHVALADPQKLMGLAILTLGKGLTAMTLFVHQWLHHNDRQGLGETRLTAKQLRQPNTTTCLPQWCAPKSMPATLCAQLANTLMQTFRFSTDIFCCSVPPSWPSLESRQKQSTSHTDSRFLKVLSINTGESP